MNNVCNPLNPWRTDLLLRIQSNVLGQNQGQGKRHEQRQIHGQGQRPRPGQELYTES